MRMAKIDPQHTKPLEGGFGRMSASQYLQHLAQGTAGATAHGRAAARTKKPRRQEEEDLQRDVFTWIALHEGAYPQLRWFFHVPNGGARSKGEAGKLKAMGVRKGVADVICPFSNGPYRGFACEIKSRVGRTTVDQDEFLETAATDVWVWGVARTLEEFVALVATYLNAPELACTLGAASRTAVERRRQ